MTTILRIDASVRRTDNSVAGHNSISRQIAQTFFDRWAALDAEVEIVRRDVGTAPPDFISQDWIAAAFTPAEKRSDAQRERLRLSDTLIGELERADILVISTPMYNYGMPAHLKAWFDQVIRIDRTFTFDLARGDFPLRPILSNKVLVLITSSGEFGFRPGGIREKQNHLTPHIETLRGYLGAEEVIEISAEYQEFGDERHRKSVEAAHREAARAAERLVRRFNPLADYAAAC
mgnify:CR=1 FL=1